MKKWIFSILFLSSFNCFIEAQQPPCMPDFLGLSFKTAFQADCPPDSRYMPFDALISYAVIDSPSRNVNFDDVINFVEHQSYNDTLRKIISYWYSAKDYNPIKYSINSYQECANEHFPKREIEASILNTISRVSPQKFIDITLIESSVIAHVKITDTLRRIDPSAIVAKTGYIVNCQIIETFKGRVIPECKDVSLYYPVKTKSNDKIQSAIPGSCLQFEYFIEWNRGGDTQKNYLDENGNLWIKKDSEYIVFLEVRIICDYENLLYYALSPLRSNQSMSGSMFPVINGELKDIDNEFGFGASVPISIFKSKLRSKINEIK